MHTPQCTDALPITSLQFGGLVWRRTWCVISQNFAHVFTFKLAMSRAQRPKTRFRFCFPATHALPCSSSVAPSVLPGFSKCHPGELFSLTFYVSTRCHLQAEKFTSHVRSIPFMPSWCLPLALNPDSLHSSCSHPSFRLKEVKN